MTNIRDVARQAAVSTATVSRVLNGAEGVNPTTRTRVMDAVRQLGYAARPSPARDGGVSPNSVALVVPDLENSFYGSIAKGMHRRANASDCVIIVSETGEDTDQERAAAEKLIGITKGVVLASARSSDDVLSSLGSRGRVVLINREIDGMASVASDNQQGTTQILQHLRACGHTRVGYAGGPVTSWSDRERRSALRNLEEDGRIDGIEVVDLGSFDVSPGGGLAAADMAIIARVTAVIVFNDHLAFGLLARLNERGLRVPEDLSVVGFDDVPLARLVSPQLTTVAVPAVDMGSRAVEILTGYEEGQDRPRIRARVELQVRGSTGLVG